MYPITFGARGPVRRTSTRRRPVLNRKVSLLLLILSLSWATTAVLAQQGQQPLTNADVVKMVKSGLPASVVSNAIQANDTDFDVSANGLIALQKAGVPQAVMDAMISASSKKRSGAAAASSAPAAAPRSEERRVGKGGSGRWGAWL